MSKVFLNTYTFRPAPVGHDVLEYLDLRNGDEFKFNMASEMNKFVEWLSHFSYRATYMISFMYDKKEFRLANEFIQVEMPNIFWNMDVAINNSNLKVPTRMKITELLLDSNEMCHVHYPELEQQFIRKIIESTICMFAEYERRNL